MQPAEKHDVADNAAFRGSIYNGAIVQLPATPASLQLCAAVNEVIEAALQGKNPQRAHEVMDYNALSALVLPLRTDLAQTANFHGLLKTLMASAGFDAAEHVIDPLRLRSVMHNGHLSAGAEKAYALHRDTWYGNPQAQINWWIPLQDVSPAETFAFYPALFKTPVENTSRDFDYAQLVGKAGWQGTKGGTYANYPAAPANSIAPAAGFAAKKGDIILFSAAQLHGTCRNDSGRTRWSLDFRSVHMDDHAKGRGAINIDNGSAPTAYDSYLRLT